MRRALSVFLFLALLLGGTRLQVAAALSPCWRMSRQPGIPIGLSQLPLRFARDPMPDQLIAFLERVDRIMPAGASVAIVLPPPWNRAEAGYATFRLAYLLPDRPVFVAVDAKSVPPNGTAYVAVWPAASPPGAGEVIYNGHGGTLLRTART